MMDPAKALDEPSYFIEEFIGVEPFGYQKEFMDHQSSRKLFCAGRRVGKSRTASWLALWKAITHEGVEVLITAKAQRQSMELFNQVKSEIRNAQKNKNIPSEEWGISRDTRTEINFQNGSRIIALPVGRDGSNIRGYGADMLIVDEAAFIEDHIFQEVLSPMLAVGDGDFILISTPMGKQGFFYQRWDEATKSDSKTDDENTIWFPQHVPTSANPKISERFIKEQENALTHTQFKQEILGEFEEFSDTFFNRKELDNCTVSSPVKREDEVTFLGVDLAASGADESVYVSIDAAGNVFSVEHTDNKSLTEAMDRVKELNAFNQYATILVDQTGLGQGPVESLQQEVGPKVEGFKFTNEKKQSLYNTLKRKMQQGEIQFYYVPGKNDLDEVMMYNQCLELKRDWTPSGKIKIEAPTGGHDDFSDALALAVWAQSQKNNARHNKESMKPFNLGSLR